MSISIQLIKQVAADHFGITLAELESQRRTQHIIRPRHVAMYCAVKLTRHSLPIIGEKFGKKDHTTVLHARNKIADLMISDKELEGQVNAVIAICEDQPPPKFDVERALKIAKNVNLTKRNEELKLEAQTLTSQISSLSKHLARLEKTNQPIATVIKAIDAYEDAQFGMGELQASKAVFKACFDLRNSFPNLQSPKKAN